MPPKKRVVKMGLDEFRGPQEQLYLPSGPRERGPVDDINSGNGFARRDYRAEERDRDEGFEPSAADDNLDWRGAAAAGPAGGRDEGGFGRDAPPAGRADAEDNWRGRGPAAGPPAGDADADRPARPDVTGDDFGRMRSAEPPRAPERSMDDWGAIRSGGPGPDRRSGGHDDAGRGDRDREGGGRRRLQLKPRTKPVPESDKKPQETPAGGDSPAEGAAPAPAEGGSKFDNLFKSRGPSEGTRRPGGGRFGRDRDEGGDRPRFGGGRFGRDRDEARPEAGSEAGPDAGPEAGSETAPAEDGGRFGRGNFGGDRDRDGGGRFGGGRFGGDRDREGGGRFGGGRFGGDRDREGGGRFGGDRDREGGGRFGGGRFGGDRDREEGSGGRFGGGRFGGRFGGGREREERPAMPDAFNTGRRDRDREDGGGFGGGRRFGGGREREERPAMPDAFNTGRRDRDREEGGGRPAMPGAFSSGRRDRDREDGGGFGGGRFGGAFGGGRDSGRDGGDRPRFGGGRDSGFGSGARPTGGLPTGPRTDGPGGRAGSSVPMRGATSTADAPAPAAAPVDPKAMRAAFATKVKKILKDYASDLAVTASDTALASAKEVCRGDYMDVFVRSTMKAAVAAESVGERRHLVQLIAAGRKWEPEPLFDEATMWTGMQKMIPDPAGEAKADDAEASASLASSIQELHESGVVNVETLPEAVAAFLEAQKVTLKVEKVIDNDALAEAIEKVVSSGKTGAELLALGKEAFADMTPEAIAAPLMTAIIKRVEEGGKLLIRAPWTKPDQYGALLAEVMCGNTPASLSALYALQVELARLKFPKGIIEGTFMGLYEADVIEEEAFVAWKEDLDHDPSDGKSKLTAIIQLSRWFEWLLESDDDSEDDDDSDDEEDE